MMNIFVIIKISEKLYEDHIAYCFCHLRKKSNSANKKLEICKIIIKREREN